MKKDLMLEFLEEYYQKNGTINNIPNSYEVMYQGKRLAVYAFLARMRRDYNSYQSNIKRKGIDSSLSLERYQKLAKMNFDWSLRNHTRNVFFDTDIYIKYLEKHYQEHQTINDIEDDKEVEYNNQILKIGSYLKEMRARFLKYGPIKFESKVKSRKVVSQYKKLTEMNFNWFKEQTQETEKQLNLSYSDIYIRALQAYYEEHGTINDISGNYTVEFEDETLNLAQFLRTMRQLHKHYQIGSTKKRGAHSELSQYRYQALEEMNFDFENQIQKKQKEVNKEPIIKYLKYHYKKYGTINNIPPKMVVLFENETLNVGEFISKIKIQYKAYQSEKNKSEIDKLCILRFKILEQLEIDWTLRSVQKRKNVLTDLEMQYLEEHFRLKGTINDITSSTVVVYQGEKLKIGAYLSKIRSNHKKYLLGEKEVRYSGELALARYKKLDELEIEWNGRNAASVLKVSKEPIIRYLEIHYRLFGTINNIKKNDKVVFEGQELQIGDYLSSMRFKHNKTISHNDQRFTSQRYLEIYKKLDELGITWTKKRNSLLQPKEQEEFLQDYYNLTSKVDGKVEKAFNITKLNRSFKEQEYTLEEILTKFNLNEKEFIKILNKLSLKLIQDKEKIHLESNMTLSDFCKHNGYKEELLQYAIKLKMKDLCDEDLESLLNRSIFHVKKFDEKTIPNWIYLKYGTKQQLDNLLSFIELDKNKALASIKENLLTLEEVIEDESFTETVKEEFSYLKGVYKLYTRYYENIISDPTLEEEKKDFEIWLYEVNLYDEYPLTGVELNQLQKAFKNYQRKSYKYKLFDVAFEKDEEKQLAKILKYNFTETEIIEACFLPLEFKEESLIGRDKELYQIRHKLFSSLENEKLPNELKEHEYYSKTVKVLTKIKEQRQN